MVGGFAHQFTPSQVQCVRGLENLGMFSAKFLYNKLQQGATVAHAKDIWKIIAPVKV
jgi:hypothetical protein